MTVEVRRPAIYARGRDRSRTGQASAGRQPALGPGGVPRAVRGRGACGRRVGAAVGRGTATRAVLVDRHHRLAGLVRHRGRSPVRAPRARRGRRGLRRAAGRGVERQAPRPRSRRRAGDLRPALARRRHHPSLRSRRGRASRTQRGLPAQGRHRPVGHLERAARVHALRPVMPRPLQIALRRRYAGVQRRSDFPRWPAETALHDLVDRVLGWAADAAGEPLRTWPWPDEHAWALVLTHDVEKAAGRDAIDRVRAVEAAAGVRSSWNLVPERYDVPDALVARLHAAGCEVGVHGLSRRPGSGVPPHAATPAATDARMGGALGRGGLPGASHPSRLGMDAAAWVRLRLVLPRHRSLRAHGRGLLHVAAVLQRRPGGAPDHARAGPHGVRHPAARRAALAREDRSAAGAWRHGAARHAPGLPDRRRGARRLPAVPRDPSRRSRRLARAAIRGRGLVASARCHVAGARRGRLVERRPGGGPGSPSANGAPGPAERAPSA